VPYIDDPPPLSILTASYTKVCQQLQAFNKCMVFFDVHSNN
jgi:hypothetical protein